jgi:methylenetetrahydrofolate--tRNA-(uracil-5-)-methyltransferase
VPAGAALAMDRDRFAEIVSERIASHPGIELRRGEVTAIPEGEAVLATGPLTSPALSAALQELLGGEYLYFYDAIAPIVDGETLDYDRLFWQSRWGKGEGDDYLNAALDRAGYAAFHQALLDAEVLPLHDFEKGMFFEGCLPIEELARRGVDTPRLGPMKPVGLTPPDGRRAYAIVQLRQENLAKSHYNLVGFQSRLKWDDQKRVFRRIPGLEKARFERLGQVHRNTFVNAPVHLDKQYRLRRHPRVRLAGQITGVEGYLESAATGLVIALYLALERRGGAVETLPATTALGALARHLTESEAEGFQPANINYGLFETLLGPGGRIGRKERRRRLAERAAAELREWMERCRFADENAAAPAPAAAEAAG